MKYIGSKARHAMYLAPFILDALLPKQMYVEPFCGGCNMLQNVLQEHRMANDQHPFLIAMFKAVQQGWEPPDALSEGEYADIRNNQQAYPPELVGFVGFGCSFSGKWFGGYARGATNKGEPRNYCAESKRNLLSQVPLLAGVRFSCGPYTTMPLPRNSVIYCDPPYAGTVKYATGGFDSAQFWQWCVDRSAEGHIVFVSEYTVPDGVPVIELWSKEVHNTLDLNTGAKAGVERFWLIDA